MSLRASFAHIAYNDVVDDDLELSVFSGGRKSFLGMSSGSKKSLLGNSYMKSDADQCYPEADVLEATFNPQRNGEAAMRHKTSSVIDNKSFFGTIKESQKEIEDIFQSIQKFNELNREVNTLNGNFLTTNSDRVVIAHSMISSMSIKVETAKGRIRTLNIEIERLKAAAYTSVEKQEIKVRAGMMKKLLNRYDEVILKFQEVEDIYSRCIGDRLMEFKRSASKIHPNLSSYEDDRDTSRMSYSLLSLAKTKNGLDEFFRDVETIQRDINGVTKGIEQLNDIIGRYMQATTNEQEVKVSDETPPVIRDTNRFAVKAKQLLNSLRKIDEQTRENLSLQLKDLSDATKSPDSRIRENLLQAITRKFVEVMKEYQSAQTNYKLCIKKKVKRQISIIKPDVTTDEVDLIIHSDGGAGNIYKTTILKGDAAETIQNEYINVQSKYNDVIVLEKSVEEMFNLFRDFALMTEMQSELMDRIEHQVMEAREHVDHSNVLLDDAVNMKRAARICQAKILCTLIIIVVLIAVITTMWEEIKLHG